MLPERPDWRRQAESLGFCFHTMYGEPYWDETRAWAFSLEEIETRIEDPSAELHAMCLHAVDKVVKSEELMSRLAIPEVARDAVAASWSRQDPHLYGRFDLAYDGQGPAKMLEYNADTPTSLYEAGFFQWLWLEDQIAAGVLPRRADQFNAIQEVLIGRLREIFPAGAPVHFASVGENIEDRQTVRYLEDCAQQAGLVPVYVPLEAIGVDDQGRFADDQSRVIERLFKLYPLEQMLRDPFAPELIRSSMQLVEPLWKAVLSNKGILPVLWKMFPNHPNLLPAYFEDEADASVLGSRFVKKPLFSREGANVTLFRDGAVEVDGEGDYGAEGHVLQAYAPLAKEGDDYAVIGSWIVGDAACGMGIREDRDIVTRDMSRFVPHFID